MLSARDLWMLSRAARSPADRHVDPTRSQYDGTGVQVDDAPAWPSWRHRRGVGYRADLDDVDGSAVVHDCPVRVLIYIMENIKLFLLFIYNLVYFYT